MYTHYAGIGSRQTPPHILQEMTRIAEWLGSDESHSLTLRSGGASGADTAFASGAYSKDIYLPWRGFNNITDGIVCGDDLRLQAIAAQYHPNWPACSRGARALHTRNVAQILGHLPTSPRSSFVVCYTPDGLASGGTGQAIRIALAHNIPVFNLFHKDAFPSLELLLLKDH